MNILTKAILLIIFVIVVVLLYAALVAGSKAEDIEQAYWQKRAREEGREHGNKKDSR
jgi:uncharacterized membrane protein